MLVIRLSRTGKKHSPHYRIVVQEKRSKLDGKAIDQVGHYHPADKAKELVLDKDKIAKWLAAGAQPSDTVTNLLVKEKILKADRKVTFFYTPKAKEEKTEEKKAAPAAPAAEEEVKTEEAATAETPTEEAPKEETPATEETPVAEEAAPVEAPATAEAPAEETPAEEAPVEAAVTVEEEKKEEAAA